MTIHLKKSEIKENDDGSQDVTYGVDFSNCKTIS